MTGKRAPETSAMGQLPTVVKCWRGLLSVKTVLTAILWQPAENFYHQPVFLPASCNSTTASSTSFWAMSKTTKARSITNSRFLIDSWFLIGFFNWFISITSCRSMISVFDCRTIIRGRLWQWLNQEIPDTNSDNYEQSAFDFFDWRLCLDEIGPIQQWGKDDGSKMKFLSPHLVTIRLFQEKPTRSNRDEWNLGMDVDISTVAR